MFGRSKPVPAPAKVQAGQRYSLERDGKVVVQFEARAIEVLYSLAGQWAPYKAHYSGKLVTAYQFTETKVWSINHGMVSIAIDKGDMLYADTDFRAGP